MDCSINIYVLQYAAYDRKIIEAYETSSGFKIK